MKRILTILTFTLAGCCGTPEFTRPPSTGDPWDTTYLIDADPASVTTAALLASVASAESRMQAATVEGVIWPRLRSDASLAEPDLFVSGGDSALFSGVAAASWAWKYAVTGATDDRARLIDAIRGLYLVTPATGTPGVICRCAFPMSRASEFDWPWPWRAPFTGTTAAGVVTDPWGGTFPEVGYYTRSTRDQLSGLVLGLATAWRVLDGDPAPESAHARGVLRDIGNALVAHLEAYDWNIRDQHGENDTGADDVDGLLRLGLEGFVAVANGHPTAPVADRLRDHIGSTWEALTRWANRFTNFDQYFAHNLRTVRTLTIWMLVPQLDPTLAPTVCAHARDAWWRYVRGHRSAWYDAAWQAISRENRDTAIGYSLRSLTLKPVRGWASPYVGQVQEPPLQDALLNCTTGWVVDPHLRKPTSYVTWQKEAWDVGDHPDTKGMGQDIGLAMGSAYWLWRWAQQP